MKLELRDEKGSTGVFIELPLDQLREEIGLVSSSAAKPTKAEVQLKESQDKPAELEGKKSLVDQVAAWVDTRVIAEMVVDHLKSEGLPRTLEEAKKVWYNALEMLGGNLAELKEKLAKGAGKTMDDFSQIEKATFVIAWGKGLSPENKAIFAEQVMEIPIAKVTEAAVAEKEPKAKVEENPNIIRGRTNKPGYKYLELVDYSVKEK